MAGGWSELPKDLLLKISQKFAFYSDYARLRAVCIHWRLTIPRFTRRLQLQMPYLMLPLSESGLQSHRSFYDLSTDRTCHIELPEACSPELRIDSSNGWLVIFDNSSAIALLNPFTRANFLLPPLYSFPNVESVDYFKLGNEYSVRYESSNIYEETSLSQMRDLFIKKLVLSSPVEEENFTAVAIINKNGGLAYCKNDHPSWISMGDFSLSFCDLTFYNDRFYAVDQDGSMVVCNVTGESPTVLVIRTTFWPERIYTPRMVYVVSSGDKQLLVVRLLNFIVYRDHRVYLKTKSLDVYMMDWSRKQWERVGDLGDRLLFVGEHSSVSLSAGDYGGCLRIPRTISLKHLTSRHRIRNISPNNISEEDFYGRCLKNCIFFTDDNCVRWDDSDWNTDSSFLCQCCCSKMPRDEDGTFEWDRGIYTLRGGTTLALPCSRTRDPHALWVLPPST